jgi:hypothetical protein
MDRITRVSLVMIVTLLLAASAHAQEGADSERLYKEGWRLYQAKQYAEACPLLERSQAAAPTLRTRGALALCYEEIGRLASAYRTWKALADQAKEAGAVEQPRMKRALQKVEQLSPRVARVVFQVVESPPNVQVLLDGQPLAASELGAALPVDPGSHAIDAKAPDRVDWHGNFDLGKPDEGKTRSLPIGPLAPIQRVENVQLPEGQGTVDNSAYSRTPAPPTRHWPTLRYVAIASAGAGVVAIAVGAIFAVSANSKWSDAKAMGCDDNGTCRTQAGVDLVNDAGSKSTIGTIGIGAGIALVAGGAALWFFTPSEESPKPSVTPAVSIGPDGAHLGLRGSF